MYAYINNSRRYSKEILTTNDVNIMYQNSMVYLVFDIPLNIYLIFRLQVFKESSSEYYNNLI